MSSDWPVVRLGDHVDSSLGKMLDKNKNKGTEKPYLGNSDVRWGYFDLTDLSKMKFEESEADRYGIKSGDLIVCEGGEPGRCAIWKDDAPNMKIQKALHRVRTKPTLNNYYLYYWFLYSGSRGTLEPYFTGTTIKHLTGKALKDLEIQLPPLWHQEYVAKVMKGLDDKIRLNHQTNQTLEHIAQAIFKSWFVDFDPTRAKIAAKQAGQDPERAAMAAISGKALDELDQLSSDQLEQLRMTAGLFPDGLVDSELGEVPEGWEVKPLSKMVELIGGGTPKKSEGDYWGGDIPWFSVKDAPAESDVFVVDTDLKITELGLNKSSTKLLPEGVTIISARGTVGRLALVGVPTAMNQSCYGVKGINGTGAYLNYLNVKEAVSTLQQNTHGAVFDTITKDTFDTVFLVDGSVILKTEFEKTVTHIFQKIKNNVFENKSLEQVRDSLLPKLLSGELSANPVELREYSE